MANYFGYLRVSTEAQDVDSQKLGVLEYANRHGFAPVTWISETVSRNKDWQSRELGGLIERVGRGDVIMVSEFTRLAAKPSQVYSFLEAASVKGVVLHVTKSNIVMDGSIQSQLLASVFSMASMIELSFIRERTKEGLQRVKAEGKILGRPLGSKSSLKLDADPKNKDVVSNQIRLGVSKRQIAKNLEVSYNTIDRFIERHKL